MAYEHFMLLYNPVTGKHFIESNSIQIGMKYAEDVLPAKEVFSQTYCDEYLKDYLQVELYKHNINHL
tara:strand:+ start:23738 stop:23938 length:201 start_codon:yes stop_codon:yes gene_type:complete